MQTTDTSVALLNANYNSAAVSKMNTAKSDALLKEQTDKFEAFFTQTDFRYCFKQ